MNAAEFLTLAKANIDTPEKWTKGYWARDGKGEPVGSSNPKAVCYCSDGALNKVGFETVDQPGEVWSKAYEFLNNACASLHGMGVVKFNDKPLTTHRQIMQVWDAAIKAAKESENER